MLKLDSLQSGVVPDFNYFYSGLLQHRLARRSAHECRDAADLRALLHAVRMDTAGRWLLDSVSVWTPPGDGCKTLLVYGHRRAMVVRPC